MTAPESVTPPLHVALSSDAEPAIPEDGAIGFDVQIWVDAFECWLAYGAAVAAVAGTPGQGVGLADTLTAIVAIGADPAKAAAAAAALDAHPDTRGARFPAALRLELADLATAISEGTVVLPELTLDTTLRTLRSKLGVNASARRWLRDAITSETGVDYLPTLTWQTAANGAAETWATLVVRCPERLEGYGGGVDAAEDGRQINANRMLRTYYAARGKTYLYATRDTDLAYADPRSAPDATAAAEVVRTIHYEPVNPPARNARIDERMSEPVQAWWCYNLPAERTGYLRTFHERVRAARNAARTARTARTAAHPQRPIGRKRSVVHRTGGRTLR